ncbi:hypothetical protein ACJ5XU_004255, partial [Providencia stuartii]
GRSQLKALLPIWLISITTCSIAWLITNLISVSPWISIILIITMATLFYILSIRFLQKDLYKYIMLNILPKKLTKTYE